MQFGSDGEYAAPRLLETCAELINLMPTGLYNFRKLTQKQFCPAIEYRGGGAA